jgi:hypothetical protein
MERETPPLICRVRPVAVSPRTTPPTAKLFVMQLSPTETSAVPTVPWAVDRVQAWEGPVGWTFTTSPYWAPLAKPPPKL